MGAFTHSLLSSEQTGITHSLTCTSQARMGVAMFRLARYRLRAPAGAPGRHVEAEALRVGRCYSCSETDGNRADDAGGQRVGEEYLRFHRGTSRFGAPNP